jgi:hypothetical protein
MTPTAISGINPGPTAKANRQNSFSDFQIFIYRSIVFNEDRAIEKDRMKIVEIKMTDINRKVEYYQ